MPYFRQAPDHCLKSILLAYGVSADPRFYGVSIDSSVASIREVLLVSVASCLVGDPRDIHANANGSYSSAFVLDSAAARGLSGTRLLARAHRITVFPTQLPTQAYLSRRQHKGCRREKKDMLTVNANGERRNVEQSEACVCL